MSQFQQINSLLRLWVMFCLIAPWSAVTAHESEAKARWSTDELTFKSTDGVILSGALIAPKDKSPIAVVVLVHGSGPAERYTALGAILALRGIAVLTYDKRGVGKSGGQYDATNNVSSSNLQLLASDASAAMAWLANEPKWQALPHGFVGISQAGWVIPLALSNTPKVDFVGFWSGPTCTTSEQLHFQHFSEKHKYDLSQVGEAELAETMKHVAYRPDDFDPLKGLTTQTVPMLWLWGGKDPYVPVGLSTRRLQTLIDQNQSNFTYRVFPSEGHNLADSPQQESFIAMTEWINRTVSTPHSTRP